MDMGNDWEKAIKHLQDVRYWYTAIGAAGIFGLTFVLNPLLVRYEKGERTQELYDSIMNTE